jgi:gas vesicle protein
MKKFLIKGAVLGVILGTIGGIFFNQKSGRDNREKMKKAAKKVMARIIAEIGPASELTKKHYDKIVGKVIADFREDKIMSAEAWEEIGEELKERWKEINLAAKKKLVSVKKK